MPRLSRLPVALLTVLLSLSAAGALGPGPGPREKVKPPTGQPGAGEPTPRTFTWQRDRVTLAEALKELTRQTGIAVADRTGPAARPAFELKGKALSFWQALDAIAAAARARVALYGPAGTVALVDQAPADGDAAPAALPVSSRGVFRTSVKSLAVARDLETGAHHCVVHLDLAWEPGFTPFFVETGPATALFAADARGKALKVEVPSTGREQIQPPAGAHEIVLRLRAPHRSAPAIATLKGSVVVTGAVKMLTFTFDPLRAIGPRDKAEEQTQEGVRVRLTDVARDTDPDRFSVRVVVDNPPSAVRLSSHEYAAWLGNSAIWLERKGGKQRLRPTRFPEVDKVDARQAIVRYDFTQKDNANVRFGQLGDWVLHYRTAGRMVELTVPYEFKDVPLP